MLWKSRFLFRLFLVLAHFPHFGWLMSLLPSVFASFSPSPSLSLTLLLSSSLTLFLSHTCFSVEKTVRNGFKTTKLQLSTSLKEITGRIESLMRPMANISSAETLASLIENNNVIKSITLNRQCERFLYDLLNILTEHQIYIERYLKNYRSQLNKIHETVKFRTAIPITSIFVSICFICLAAFSLSRFKYIIFN